jgi:hypothetical protein
MRRFDKGAIDSDDQVLRAFFDDRLRGDLRLRLGLDHLADGQDATARRRVD